MCQINASVMKGEKKHFHTTHPRKQCMSSDSCFFAFSVISLLTMTAAHMITWTLLPGICCRDGNRLLHINSIWEQPRPLGFSNLHHLRGDRTQRPLPLEVRKDLGQRDHAISLLRHQQVIYTFTSKTEILVRNVKTFIVTE